MRSPFVVTFLLTHLLFGISTSSGLHTGAFGDIFVQYPGTIIGNLPFSISLLFPIRGPDFHKTWDDEYHYQLIAVHLKSGRQAVISSGILPSPTKAEKISFDISDVRDAGLKTPSLDSFCSKIDNVSLKTLSRYGSIKLVLSLSTSPFQENPSGFESGSYTFSDNGYTFAIPAWLSILPSICTIILAILLKQSLLAIFAGAWVGTTLLYHGNPLIGFFRTLDTTLIRGISSPDHACVLLFCLFIGGMIGVLGVGGGANGLALVVTKFAKTRRRASLATFLVGILIFFDDYASCLICGLTMKDITGTMKISREKLSFIADTCAANISTLSIISSWICIEISYIVQEFSQLGMETDGYSTFIRALPYNFYPISMLGFCLLGIILNRDFGPMLTAERRAHRTGQLVKPGSVPLGGDNVESSGDAFMTPKKGIRSLWWNAAIPFLVVITVVVFSMLGDGAYAISRYRDVLLSKKYLAGLNHFSSLESHIASKITEIDNSWGPISWVSASVPFNGLLWASLLASFTAIILVVSQRILSISEAMNAWVNGAKSMLFAVIILILAWGLGDVCRQLKAAEWISSSLGKSLSAYIFPTIVFITSSAVSFATGSAWGTMSILFPLMVQMAYTLQTAADPVSDPSKSVCLLATVASILGGAVWGNQSSPIADSCIMSSVASGSDHNDHVYTQLGYTVPVGIISILVCNLPISLGLYPWPVGYVITFVLFLSIFFLIGGRQDADDDLNDPYLLKWLSRTKEDTSFPKGLVSSTPSSIIIDGGK